MVLCITEEGQEAYSGLVQLASAALAFLNNVQLCEKFPARVSQIGIQWTPPVITRDREVTGTPFFPPLFNPAVTIITIPAYVCA